GCAPPARPTRASARRVVLVDRPARMSSDEITPKLPRRPRARGAPPTAPATGADAFEVEEAWRRTCRARAVSRERASPIAAPRAACARRSVAAERQRLTILEEPLFGVKGEPGQDPPHRWEYEAVLPIRGAARPVGDVAVARIDGGLHLAARTPRG